MDKEKATRILAKALAEKVGSSVVGEVSYKDRLVEKAYLIYQVGEPFFVLNDHYHDKKIFVVDDKTDFLDANYFFLETLPGDCESYESRCMVTPYALIGDKEEKDIRGIFYKDIPPEVVYAMDFLNIKHYADIYAEYSHPDCAFKNLEQLKLAHQDTTVLQGANGIRHSRFMDDQINSTLGRKFLTFFRNQGHQIRFDIECKTQHLGGGGHF